MAGHLLSPLEIFLLTVHNLKEVLLPPCPVRGLLRLGKLCLTAKYVHSCWQDPHTNCLP